MKSIYKNAVVNALSKATKGQLTLTLPSGEKVVCGDSDQGPPVEWIVKSDAVFKAVALQSDIGLGESYMLDDWTSPNTTELLQWFIRNSESISPQTGSPLQFLAKTSLRLVEKARHALNRNTKEGSRKNIHVHYDLGNDFYQTFLDETMTYSSAFFAEESFTLEEAQVEKYDRICKKMKLGASHNLLEIGCGWGGFAVHAVKNYGCRVTATTISEEQRAFAAARVKAEGLEDRIQIILTDYRDLVGRFDRIASIEMLEAVGHEFLPAYFKRVDELLNPDGLAVVQVITTPTPLYRGYRKKADWIQKHIFPGANLPSNKALIDAAGRLEVMHLESFGLHYARTLKAWRERFLANWQQIEPMGFDDTFRRKWSFYFSYCEAGFRQRHINVSQIALGRPDELGYGFEQSSHFADSANEGKLHSSNL